MATCHLVEKYLSHGVTSLFVALIAHKYLELNNQHLCLNYFDYFALIAKVV